MTEKLSVEERIALGPDESFSGLDAVISTEARERVLREPYFGAEKVQEMLGENDVESLITDGTLLAYKDHGEYLFPVFQFNSETGRPYEAVVEVNRMTDASEDGWAMTDFWAFDHASIHMPPKELLGTQRERVAVRLGHALISQY